MRNQNDNAKLTGDGMDDRHLRHKQRLAAFLDRIAQCDPADTGAVLNEFCAPDCVWEVFHPFNRLETNAAAAERFWRPLRAAMPDYELRPAMLIGGAYEGRDQVSMLGHAMGTLADSWLTIPATWQLSFLRFGLNATVEDGRFVKVYIMLDIPDLMRQAGYWPLRRMPGSPEQWPFPPAPQPGASIDESADRGQRTLDIVIEMQLGLPKEGEAKDRESATAKHSHHWHENMNWYGPAGIGSSRGLRGFREYHGALFLQAFADRAGFPREEGGPEDAPGHYTQLGDGRFAVTGGWPSLRGRHTGGQWLGLPPTGVELMMRVTDWYRLDLDDKIIDNWVMIDIPHMLDQMGLDILDDLRFFVDPEISRMG